MNLTVFFFIPQGRDSWKINCFVVVVLIVLIIIIVIIIIIIKKV